MKKIVAASPALMERHKQMLREYAERCGYEIRFCESNAEAIPEVKNAEIVYGQGNDLYEACDGVKWFCSMSAGVDSYLAEGVWKKEMILTNSSGCYGLTISEHTVMVTLELLRRRKEYDQIVAKREWIRDLPIRSIYGSRVTIVGTGNIGTEIAKRLHAFDPACILGVNRSGHPVEGRYTKIYRQDEIEQILPETDLLILALPGTKETTHFLSKERIALLPETSFVVNVGRGNAIDQAALLEALNTGNLQGAALDVFEREPLPQNDPAWDCPRLIITPHSSGNMSLPYTVEENVRMFCRDLEHYSKGETLEHLVDPYAGY